MNQATSHEIAAPGVLGADELGSIDSIGSDSQTVVTGGAIKSAAVEVRPTTAIPLNIRETAALTRVAQGTRDKLPGWSTGLGTA